MESEKDNQTATVTIEPLPIISLCQQSQGLNSVILNWAVVKAQDIMEDIERRMCKISENESRGCKISQ